MIFHGGQAAQHVGQVILRVDTAAAATLDDGVDDCATPTGVGMADEEPALATHHRRSHVVFHVVVVDEIAALAQIPHHRRVFLEEVVDRLAQAALGQEPRVGLQLQSAALQGAPQHRGFLPTQGFALLGTQVARLIFNAVELPDLANEPDRLGTRLFGRFIPAPANMGQAPQAPEHGGPLAPQRIIDGIGIGLDGALEAGQTGLGTFAPPPRAKLQEHITPGVGVKPQVARGRFAFDLRIEHLDGIRVSNPVW